MHPLLITAITILSVDLLRHTIAITYLDIKGRTNTAAYHKRVDATLYRLWLITLIILGTQGY